MRNHSPFLALFATAALVCAAAVIASCSGSGGQSPFTSQSSTETTGSSEGTAASGGGPVPLSELDIRLDPVTPGLDNPLFVTNAGDGSGRLFVVEQGGRVRVVKNRRLQPRAFLDVSDRISSGGERGLLGLAFAPDYKTSGRFYVNYTNRSGNTVVARFVADDPASDRPSLSGPQAVFTVDQPYSNHNGGCILFSPDGELWVGMGDGGSAGDPEDRAQNPDSRLGKLLSLDVSGNGKAKVKTIASGLRNPWRFSIDAKNDDVWIGDVGQSAWEEIDRVPLAELDGKNFGWNRWEGNHPYPEGADRSKSGFTFPVLEYGHDEGQSVTGGYVYRGSEYPGMQGVYFYGDFVANWVGAARVREDGSLEKAVVLPDPGVSPSSFGVGENGDLYVCDYGGELLKVTMR